MSGTGPEVVEQLTRLTRMRAAAMRMLAMLAVAGWVGFLASAGALLSVLFARGNQSVAEQKPSGAPRLRVAPLTVAEPGTAAPFPIQLGPMIPQGSWIRITGVPTLASLSAEAKAVPHSKGGGVWIVPMAALYDLKITMPQGLTRSEIRIALMSSDGVPIVEVQSVLVPTSQCHPDPAIAVTRATPPHTGREPSSRRLTTVWSTYEDRRTYQQRMALGDDAMFLEGRVDAARLWYTFAAERGWPPAAMALAQTYDPHEISRRRLTIVPEPMQARRWYEKARELMSAAVDFYVWRLDSSPDRPELPSPR
jgi:hypothetical protein